MFAQESFRHREHFLPYRTRQIRRRLAIRRNPASLLDVPRQMPHFVHPRVQEFRRRRRERNHHHRLALGEVGISQPRVQRTVRQTTACAKPFRAQATYPAQVAEDAVAPVGRHSIVHPHVPVILRQVEVLRNHTTLSQGITTPFPIQVA